MFGGRPVATSTTSAGKRSIRPSISASTVWSGAIRVTFAFVRSESPAPGARSTSPARMSSSSAGSTTGPDWSTVTAVPARPNTKPSSIAMAPPPMITSRSGSVVRSSS